MCCMLEHLRDILTTDYGLRDVRLTAAPRQYVADTYIVESANRPTYFCKVVDKPIWIPKILGSLPVLDPIHGLGFDRANYPIKTQSGALYLMVGNTLIVLFNYIQAEQSYTFDDTAFGRVLGEVHSLTSKIHVEMPQERFL